MPAYNEAENIEEVIKEWHPVAEKINAEGNDCRIVIANDGSTDNKVIKNNQINFFINILQKETGCSDYNSPFTELEFVRIENGSEFLSIILLVTRQNHAEMLSHFK